MLTLYGNRGSSSANKVEYTLLLLDKKYEYKHLDFRKDLKTEWYLKIHPAGKVPALDDNGFILFESAAICRYLAQNTELYPSDAKARAHIDQWMDFATLHIGGNLAKVAFTRVFAPMMGQPGDENSVQEGLKFLGNYLPIVDAALAKHTYLASNRLTLADISLLAALEYAEASKVDLSSYKHLVAWRHKLMDMDFWKKVHSSN